MSSPRLLAVGKKKFSQKNAKLKICPEQRFSK